MAGSLVVIAVDSYSVVERSAAERLSPFLDNRHALRHAERPGGARVPACDADAYRHVVSIVEVYLEISRNSSKIPARVLTSFLRDFVSFSNILLLITLTNYGESYMRPVQPSSEDVDFKIEFLLIFTKFEKINEKLDLILKQLEPNAEDLLSQSEIDMMKSWRAQAIAMESNEADNTPTGS